MKLEKEVYKYIDYELHHYEENKKKLEEIRNDIIESSPMPQDGQPSGKGFTGNPTEKKAIKLITSVAIMKLEDNVIAIDNVYHKLTEDYKRFFDLNYKNKVGIVRTCIEASISEKTYYRWRDSIIEMVANEMGLK